MKPKYSKLSITIMCKGKDHPVTHTSSRQSAIGCGRFNPERHGTLCTGVWVGNGGTENFSPNRIQKLFPAKTEPIYSSFKIKPG